MGNFQTVLLPTTDLAASRELYTKLLGVPPVADSDYYVGFDVDGQQIGLVPGTTAVVPHLHVDDLEQAIALITEAGGSVVEDPKAVGGSRRVAVIQDPSGARFGLTHDA
ncbi:VOC family protein [Flexivirga oryzae]|uniref:Putative enzyme related to lactoylglutathione lyase n=1 Tax=Flexivirga oryzae TaxID=1794944 RepID=A0A839N852_9MICO|nr:VOC family protein [Flexivirga oryzae]MBB2892959.1 putative enzyme related to lactoylglutathione lyase [Flexivirga oryzae]